MTKFEAGKEYKTIGGRTARIYAVDCGGTHPIHGAILADNGTGYMMHEWTNNGFKFFTIGYESSLDLMPPEPEKITVWVNVYADRIGFLSKTKDEADIFASGQRIACVPLTYYKGEGLE